MWYISTTSLTNGYILLNIWFTEKIYKIIFRNFNDPKIIINTNIKCDDYRMHSEAEAWAT